MRLAAAALLLLTGCSATETSGAPVPDSHGSAVDGAVHPVVKPRHRPQSLRVSRQAHRRPVAHTLTVTAYCYTGSRNAAGKWPTVGTAAANAYPLGTRLHVQGVGTVVVEDRSAPGATDVDLYLGGPDCAARAAAFGRRALSVRELPQNGGR